MDEYLTYTKRRLSELETVDRVHVVLGNEACDLDSAVAALTYAFYLHHKSVNDTGILYLPVLNITSDQYRLRTETVYFLGQLNIKQTDLTFRDDLDLHTLKATGKLDLTLVDHNVLAAPDQGLEDMVIMVIDHRPRDRPEQEGVRVVINLVGSCCTLVAEELLSDQDFNLNHQVALLLYGTILIDTVNRSVAAGKLTQQDEAVLHRLEAVLQDVNGDQLYEDIQKAKCDLSGLKTMEILEKDLKMVPGTSMTVAMSSVSIDIQELLSQDRHTSDLETFCQQKGCPVVVVMSINAADEDNLYRQLAVFSTNRIFREQICDVLDLSTNPYLQLEPIKTSLDNISIFRQGNVKASRKKVLPIIKAFLNGEKTPDIASKEFASETQQATAEVTKGFSSFSNLLDTDTTSMQNQFKESFFTGSSETHKQSFSNVDFDPFGALDSDDSPEKEKHSENLVVDSFDPFTTSSIQNQSEEELFFTASNETQFSDVGFDPFDAINNDNSPMKEEHDRNLVDIDSFDPFKTISNSESNEWQSGSEIGSLGPLNLSSRSESVQKQTGSDLNLFDTLIDPVQDQSGSSTEHLDLFHAASDSTSVQSDVQLDDFDLMTPRSLNEEAASQSGISTLAELGNLNPFNTNRGDSVRNQNLSANKNQPLLDFGPLSVGESSGEDFKNSWANPVFTSQEVSFEDSVQLSPLEIVTDSDLFKDKSSDNLKFDQDRGDSSAAQDGRDKYGSVSDSLELNEADLYDQINTPDYQSGVSTPLINSGISTPFESLPTNQSGRNSESESGYPSITQTPPHSFTESGMENLNKDHVLPSFNSSEMVQRIHNKKASLHGDTEINFNANSVPYTPQNSFIEGTLDAVMIDRDLPSFDNSEFVQKIQEKRSSLAGIHEGDMDREVNQYPYPPHNSFIGGTFDKYAQENLSSLNNAESVKKVREKQAALASFLGSDITDLSTLNEGLHTDSPSFGSVESNNPFLVNIESEASLSINPFLFVDDNLLDSEEFMSTFPPQNSFAESSAHLMENRDSFIETELAQTHSRKLPLMEDNENFQNIEAQNLTFEMFEKKNLESHQNETEEKKKDVWETGLLGNDFKEQEGQEEHERKEKSLMKEESNDSHLLKDDLLYTESGKEEVLFSGFKSAASAGIPDEDQLGLGEISYSWDQDRQQQDGVNYDNLDSGNIHSPIGKSKPDELDREDQIIESSITLTEAAGDTDEKLENECDTRSEKDLLESMGIEEIQEIAYSIAGEIIQTVLDNFPDLHIPIVTKTLQEVKSNSLEKGSGTSDIFAATISRWIVQTIKRYSSAIISEVPNKSEGESIFSLETDYLPNMDPLGGNMDLVTSPSFSALDQDNEFGDVETESFHRASREECHGDSLHEGDTARSVILLTEGLSSVPEVTIEAAQALKNETLVFVPHKLDSDLVSDHQSVSDDISLSHASDVDFENSEKLNEDQLIMNMGQAQALENEKQNLLSHEPNLDLVLPETWSESHLIDGPSFVPETNIEIAQLLESETQNLVTHQLDLEFVSHQSDSEWIAHKLNSDLFSCQPASEDILGLTDGAGDGSENNQMLSEDQTIATGLTNESQDDHKAGEQNSFPNGSVSESFRNDLIANENEVSVEVEKSSSEMESVINEKMLDLAGNIVNSVLASAIECTMGEGMRNNAKRHVVSEESVDFSPVSTSLEDEVMEFASETEIDHVETVLETEKSHIGTAGNRKIFHIEAAFETEVPNIETQCETEMSHSIQATKEDMVQTSQADGEVRHDSSDSEDSETSSTTTEGSYRIEDPGVTSPPEMLYDTMDKMENPDLGQETPNKYLLAEEVIEKVNIPDLSVSIGYTYTPKMDESKQLCHMSELHYISGVPDTEDKYTVTEIVENMDLLEKQNYSCPIDLEDIPSLLQTEISSSTDSHTGADIKEIWELQDQNGHTAEPCITHTDEKVQTREGYEESVVDTWNYNSNALVVDIKQDRNKSLSADHTVETTSTEKETWTDLKASIVQKKEKLKGGYSLDLPIPFVIIQEAADDLPSEEESPSQPLASTAGKKSSDTADNVAQKNKRTGPETVKDECEKLDDIVLADIVSNESELKQVEDHAFLSEDDSTTSLKYQHANNTCIKAVLEEILESAIEEENKLQGDYVGKESACPKIMSASEVETETFDEDRLCKDIEIQGKSLTVEIEINSSEQNQMDEVSTITDSKTEEGSDASKSQSTEITADDTDKLYTAETEKTKMDEDNAFADFKPADEFDASKMQSFFNATESISEDSEKSDAPELETKSPEGNKMDEDNIVADFKLAEESDSFKSQSTEITVDSTCKDSDKAFTAEIGRKSVDENKINKDITVVDLQESNASISQSAVITANSTTKDSEKSFAGESDTKSLEENKMDEDSMIAGFLSAEESDSFKMLSSDKTTDITSKYSEKSSAAKVETMSPEQNQMDEDSTIEDFKPVEESEVSKSHLIEIIADSTGEDSEKSSAAKIETKPPQGNKMDEDNIIADFKPAEESYAFRSQSTEIAAYSTGTDFENSFASEVQTNSPEEKAMDEDNIVADFKPAEEYDAFKSQSTEIAAYSTGTDFENSFASEVQINSPEEKAMDEDNIVADFKPAEESDAFRSHSTEIAAYSTGTDFEKSFASELQTQSQEEKTMDEDNIVADFKPAEESDAFRSHSTEIAAYSTGTDFEKSFASEVQTWSQEEKTMDEDNIFADFKPAEESDPFRSQSTEIAAYSTGTDFEKSFASEVQINSPEEKAMDEDNIFADFKPAEEYDAFRSQSTEIAAYSTGTDFEKSFASEVQTWSQEEITMDEDNIVADFKPAEESDAFRSQSTEIAAYSTGTDFEKSFASELQTQSQEEKTMDEDNIVADFKPAEESDAFRSHSTEIAAYSTGTDFEKSFASEVQTWSQEEKTMDEDNIFADFKPAEESDPFRSQSTEIAAYSTGTDFEKSFASEVQINSPEEKAMDEDNIFADFKPAEEYDAFRSQSTEIAAYSTGTDFEKSFASEVQINSPEEKTMDEDNIVADFKPAEEPDAFKSQSTEIAAYSTGTEFEKSFASEVQTQSQEEKTMDEDNIFADFKPAEESDAFRSQSTEIAAYNTGTDFEKSFASEVQTQSQEEKTMDEDNIVADFKPAEEYDAFKSQSTEIAAYSTGTDFKKSFASEVQTQSQEEKAMDEDNIFADFKPAEEYDAFRSQSTEMAAYSTGTDFEKSFASEVQINSPEEKAKDEDNIFADFKPAEESDAFKSQSTEIAAYSTGTDFEKSFASEVQTWSQEEKTMDEDNIFADFKPAEESDAFRSQSTEIAAYSTGTDFEKSFASELQTQSQEEKTMDEDNIVADFKPAEESDAFRSHSTEIAAYSTGTDFENSFASEVQTWSQEEKTMDEDNIFADFKPAEESDAFRSQSTEIAAHSTGTDFKKSFASEVQTQSQEEKAMDEDNIFADFKPAEESDPFRSQSTEIAAYSTGTDFEKSFASEVQINSPEEKAMDEDNIVADFKPAEEYDAFRSQSTEIAAYNTGTDFEKSFASEVQINSPEEKTMDEDNIFADFKPAEEPDAFKSQSTEIAAYSTGTEFEKSFASEVQTQSQEEKTMDEDNIVADFKPAEESDAFRSQSTEIAAYNTGTDFEKSFASEVQTQSQEEKTMDEDNIVADFKPAEEYDAFKSQSTEIAAHSTGTDFKKSFASEVQTQSQEEKAMDEDNIFADFKPAEESDPFRSQSTEIAAYSTGTDFEKSFASEVQINSPEEKAMDEDNIVADFKPAEEYDAFRSHSTKIAAYSTGTDFEKSFASEVQINSPEEKAKDEDNIFADFKPAEESDAFRSQSTEIAAHSTGTDFKKSFASEVQINSPEEKAKDEDNIFADFKPAEEYDAFRSHSAEIAAYSTGTDFEKSFASEVQINSPEEKAMDEDNIVADFKPAEEPDAFKSQSTEIAAYSTGTEFEKSFASEVQTQSQEEKTMDEDNIFADFKPAEESDIFRSQSTEIAAYSTGTDFEKSFASEVQTQSQEEKTMDEDNIVADFKPDEESDAFKILSSDNVTGSTREHFEKSSVAEVETMSAEENKMDEDNTVADFKPAVESDASESQLTEITVDSTGKDSKKSSAAEVETKSPEENNMNNNTSKDSEKLSAAETETKFSVEEKMIEDNTIIDPKPAQESDAFENQSNENTAENTILRIQQKTLDTDNRSPILLRKEVFMTTAGRMSISIDSTYENMVPEQKEDNVKMTSHVQFPGVSSVLEELQVGQILEEADSLVADVDKTLASSHQFCDSSSTHLHQLQAASVQPTEPKDKSLKEVENEQRHKRETSVTFHGSKEKMRGMDLTEEFYEDPIPGMEAEEVSDSSDDSQVGSSDSEEDDSKPGRPSLLFGAKKDKKRIAADANILNKDESADDLLDDPPTPDDLGDGSGELEWEKRRKLQESQAKTDDTPITSPSEPLSSQYSARDDDDNEGGEGHEKNQFRKVEIAGKEHRVDMGVIEPYKKVLSHGGYYGDGLNAIILFSGCYLPDRSRRDYQYVMDNLFLYVISTLELLVAEDYMIVYFHGATPRRQMPSFGWLRKCYQTIDRRLKKNLKTLLLVHPTLWLKTVVMMTKPFISSKFSSKLRFVKTLRELATIIPMEYIYVPEPVQQYDDRLRSSTSISTPSSPSSDTISPR